MDSLHADHLGSTATVTNRSGAVVGHWRYDPYGRPRATSGALPTDYRFTGQRISIGRGTHPGCRE